ncbi:MAG: hypothetical protein FJ222_11825 [Lentisphaerae bacterium]|nr:hypothetical protein [Lentisphaerota bacterium]
MNRICTAKITWAVCCLAWCGSVVADEMKNAAFHVSVVAEKDGVQASLEDLASRWKLADGPYLYQAMRVDEKGKTNTLENATVSSGDGKVIIRGQLAGLEVEHTLLLPSDRPVMEERIVVRNKTDKLIALSGFETGFTLCVADSKGKLLPEFSRDHLMAVPFLRRANDPKGKQHDYSLQEVVLTPGYVPSMEQIKRVSSMPSPHRASEGWAWVRGDDVFGIFKFSQQNMQFSVVSKHPAADGMRLRFGGVAMIGGEPADLGRIAPGQSVDLGLVRYQMLRGGHREACYAFRGMLDEMGCRFPKDFNPPVHWEQLYDMSGAWNNRPRRFTKAILEREAAKGKAYSCEALYLDPGWDTDFGTFLWGEKWLGPRKQFIDEMQSKYGLKVSLHCPLASWMSSRITWGKNAYKSFPVESRRIPPEKASDPNFSLLSFTNLLEGPLVCLGSKQYLDVAAERMLEHCADGVVYLMFDGNWWNGGCMNPHHGHPVPYRIEDHIRANLDLAQRIHAKYPKVLIEMHDAIAGGSKVRATPIYYKYGLPGSYDMTWGFELMWNPMDDIKQGRTAALYYANLGGNVPIYTHVSLITDNEHCMVLWWYASTCRHLGIGGTNKNPAIVKAGQEAMRWYRANDRFYKRGDFYGISEEIHLHVLPGERAFTVNVFNLSDKGNTVSGSIDLKTMGMDPSLKYVSTEGVGTVENGRYQVSMELPAWGTKVGKVEAATE